ncbi:carbamate kinase [Nitriliruptor alkaliphilus]|uniref:carbamate kinase n=1 Tax=Nitriliruptor alkaliphilus TaxID=427918 RepID=UPI000695CCBA|nr:carbamate kinase [Nitriliruptor alkaliphilus]
MRIVAALGGNALLERGQKPDASTQAANVARAVAALAPLAEDHELVLTHGNGPQVGVLALQSASDPNLTTPYPFDVLGAQTQGMIGYWLLQSLQNHLPGRQVASIMNQTLVMASDPAFADPTKFIGEVYDEDRARELAAERGWTVKPDGQGWRRVIGSPRPQRVIETRLIRLLLDSGAVVVCAGGGGVPVIRNEEGRLQGVEAVVDKDLTAAVLAEALDADVLMILTDVPQVSRNFGTPEEEPIARATPAAMRREELAAGSMGPKVDAACRFVELTGDMAAIGRLEDAQEILEGKAGTIVTPGGKYGGPGDLAVPEPRRAN